MICAKTLDGRTIEIQSIEDDAVIPCGDCGFNTQEEDRYLLRIGGAVILCSHCLADYDEKFTSLLMRSDGLGDAVRFVLSGNELVVTVRFDLNC